MSATHDIIVTAHYSFYIDDETPDDTAIKQNKFPANTTIERLVEWACGSMPKKAWTDLEWITIRPARGDHPA